MIEPVAFRGNEQTALDNDFQSISDQDLRLTQESAGQEFANAVALLRAQDIDVWLFKDDATADTPDSLFANNWFSTHQSKAFVLYPLFHENRRAERRADIISALIERYPRCIDLSYHEKDGLALEGTGSLVLDRVEKLAFSGLSNRTERGLVESWCEQLGYTPVIFETCGTESPVYHTNVIMSVGSFFSVVCLELIENNYHEVLLQHLSAGDKEVLEISKQQAMSFCGNILELKAGDGQPVVVMSTRAHRAFHPDQISIMGKQARVVHTPIDTIEDRGGGGLRCMIAEIF